MKMYRRTFCNHTDTWRQCAICEEVTRLGNAIGQSRLGADGWLASMADFIAGWPWSWDVIQWATDGADVEWWIDLGGEA